MKKITVSLCVLALTFAGLYSCASPPKAQPVAKPLPAGVQTGSSVWKISGNGNTLFLGGSIHLLRDVDYPLPEEFDKAFSQSSIMVLEADIEQMANQNIALYLASRMYLPNQKTLRSVLDNDAYEMLKAECNKYGISIEGISNLKPSMIITMLSMLQIQKYGFVQQGVDTHYLEKAKSENKPVKFLETVNSQIDMLLGMGDGYESDYVRYSLLDMTNTENELSELLAEWKKGGSSRTEAMIAEMMEVWPEIYKALLSDRNAAWIPQIKRYLDSGVVYFVIAGLAHMHGPDGLLRMLENEGYSIERF